MVVEVRREVDRILVDVREQLRRYPHEPRFGVAIRGRGVAVHRPEIPLPIHERVAQREVLHHADERIVDGAVSVRMESPKHVADDRRRLLERSVREEPEVVHRVQDAPVHGVEAIAHVGKRARHDHAHRVVDERFLDLVIDETRENSLAIYWAGHVVLREGKTVVGRTEKYTRTGGEWQTGLIAVNVGYTIAYSAAS